MSGAEGSNYLLLQLGIILFWALVLGALFERLGLPAVLGYTIAGYVLGPNGAGIVHSSEFIKLLADLGIMLLLFFVGTEFNLKRLVESGSQALFLSPIKSGLGFLLGYVAAKLLGFDHWAALVSGAAVAVSSTGIISNTILEKKLQHTLEARIVLSMLIFEDIFSIVFLTFLLGQGSDLSVSRVLLHIFLVLVLILTVGVYVSRWFFQTIKRLGHQDKVALYALGLLVLFSYGVSVLGISPTLGAFFAGVALSEVAAVSRIERELEALKRFFALIFFTSIGLFYAPQITVRAFILSLLFVGIQVFNLFLLSLIAPFFGVPIRSAARLFILDLPIGEFSLFFAATASLVGVEGASEVLGAVFLTVLFTSVISNFLFRKEKEVIELVRSLSPAKAFSPFLTSLDRAATHVPDAEYSRRVGLHAGRIFTHILSLIAVAYFAWYAISEAGLDPRTVTIVAVLVAIYPLYSIVAELLRLFAYHTERLIAYVNPRMDYFARRLVARKAGVFAVGALLYTTAIILNIVAQMSGVAEIQLLGGVLLILGFLSLLYGALNLVSIFVVR